MDQSVTTRSATATAGEGLLSASFLGLLATQFLTAANDNVFRWLVIGIAKDHVAENVGSVLMAGTVCFVAPYLVLAAPSGYLADRFSKRSVIVACKVAEIVIMLLGVGAILLGGSTSSTVALALLFSVVALMGAQAALFSPAKSGAIPEIVAPEKISKANGIFSLATVGAMVIGAALGSWLCDATGQKGLEAPWISALVIVGIAVLGTLTTIPLRTPPAANPDRKVPWDFPVQTWRDLRTLASSRALLRVAMGIAFFYAIGALAQLNIDQLAAEGGTDAESAKIPLLIALIAGVSIGSVLAGFWSGDHVELGILPIGAAGMAVGSLLLFTVPADIFHPATLDGSASGMTGGAIWACILLFFLGISSGLFSVPLDAYMQHRSPREARGSILAASNFLTFSAICMASLIFAGLRTPYWASGTAGASRLPLLTPQQIFLLAGVVGAPVFVYIVWVIPQASIRFVVWLLSKTLYRIRVYGRENLPATGGALLVSNHISWIDGFLLLLTSSRPIRMIAWAPNFANPLVKRLADMYGVIPIDPKRPKSIVTALRTARQAALDGELVCIFPEGGLTRSGQVQAFRPGMMKILEGTDTPVVPIYIDGLWGSIFSFERGKFFWKWPKRIPYPLSIHFGPAVQKPDDPHQLRQAVLALGSHDVQQRMSHMPVISADFVRRCKQRKRKIKVADSMQGDMSGGQLLMRCLILRRLLRRHTLAANEQYVGVLLPPSVGGVIVNATLALDRRIAVNLNYTVSSEVMNECIKLAGIKHVLTSRKFMDKMNFKLDAEIVYLEDFKDKPTTADKISGVLHAFVTPASALIRRLGLHQVQADDVLTVIFTSGSTGAPKGVMLTYGNVGSNVDAIRQVVHLDSRDVLLGILPFFHSFGFTVTLWGVAGLDISGAYHYSPLDAKAIGKLCKKYQATLLLSTPTFLRSNMRRCEKADLATLQVVVAGAEKLPQDLIEAYDEKFGVRPVEGYGTTELSPLVSVNVPPSRSRGNEQVDRKEGSVGRPVPGVSAKVVDSTTGKELPTGQPGQLFITGPNVMKGYLHRDDLTAKAITQGWYNTGDIAYIDADGFIFITGRESRFSKIGGEMVPHIQVEEELSKLLKSESDQPQLAVTAVSDEKKGERLIVLHTKLDKTSDQLRRGLTEAGLPNLFIPGNDGFIEVEALPILGTGKLDLKGIKALAIERTSTGISGT